ncbi:MAG: hypothetical protein A2498_12430 [Lentisphaerae bacterium RIFOXYC12_FULL_60_16]|nr:MAG: hypothetical protein A2498_12430 [Lentisphaerae bacterium RIFOXYC12_FULL_60_16]OGV72218.1 MAG: hypothetical protein A2269_06500 [Lentisphaerae bacterium RIFOXYA12_FULL_60_10]OGV83593.1 MAG: hypothetical protein A2340_09530 [Lentisphaerae bacterium RIFOXYB12_FULL_60_10]
MLSPEDAVRLRHMLEATEKAMTFSKNRTRADLDTDEQLTLALTRLLEIIGEAAAAVSESVRNQDTGISWRAIIGTRNRLIHGYFDVDKDIIWKIISQDLPHLLAELRRRLA